MRVHPRDQQAAERYEALMGKPPPNITAAAGDLAWQWSYRPTREGRAAIAATLRR